jgi:hypothetical protein
MLLQREAWRNGAPLVETTESATEKTAPAALSPIFAVQ